jgi:hypothetical protein
MKILNLFFPGQTKKFFFVYPGQFLAGKYLVLFAQVNFLFAILKIFVCPITPLFPENQKLSKISNISAPNPEIYGQLGKVYSKHAGHRGESEKNNEKN